MAPLIKLLQTTKCPRFNLSIDVSKEPNVKYSLPCLMLLCSGGTTCKNSVPTVSLEDICSNLLNSLMVMINTVALYFYSDIGLHYDSFIQM